jgi:heme exporter protein D
MLGAASNQNPQRTSKSALKNPFVYSSAAIGIALLAVAWILFSRWQENRGIERNVQQQRAQKQLQQDRSTLEQMGGKELDIQSFYASASEIHRGESLQLCYGVANAKTVTLEPQSNPVWPSYSRRVDVSPAKSTTYTLTVTDASGNTKSQTLEVKVR